MKKINLKNAIWKEGKYYISWNLNTGISSFGKTKKEALKNIEEALELYFEDIPISKATKIERPAIVPMSFSYA